MSIGAAIRRLNDVDSSLRPEMEERNVEHPEGLERINSWPCGNGIHVEYFGDSFGADRLFEVLVEADLAAELVSLRLDGPDEGANGIRPWNLTTLVEPQIEFPKLKVVVIERNRPECHNRAIVTSNDVYSTEDGVLARLLALAPCLKYLTSPTAPNSEFFKVGTRPLYMLCIDAGFEPNDFVHELAHSAAFPNLRTLEWGDYAENYMPNFEQRCTPFEHYAELVQSKLLPNLRNLQVRNSPLGLDRWLELRRIAGREWSIGIVRSNSQWIP